MNTLKTLIKLAYEHPKVRDELLDVIMKMASTPGSEQEAEVTTDADANMIKVIVDFVDNISTVTNNGTKELDASKMSVLQTGLTKTLKEISHIDPKHLSTIKNKLKITGNIATSVFFKQIKSSWDNLKPQEKKNTQTLLTKIMPDILTGLKLTSKRSDWLEIKNEAIQAAKAKTNINNTIV